MELIPMGLANEGGHETKLRFKKKREVEKKMAFEISGKQPSWYEEYRQLVEAGWHWRIAAFVAWSATPRKLRWPTTQEKLAVEVLGLCSERQFCKWRRKIPVINDLICAIRLTPMLEHRADVIQALIESAVVPEPKNFKDRKLFLEITGDYAYGGNGSKESERRVGGGLRDLSDEEEVQIGVRAGFACGQG